MTSIRTVRAVTESRPTIEGAGVHLRRAIGHGTPGAFDPFLLLDDFRSDDPADYAAGFPWHPHRGMETITLVLNGTVEHRDSLGNAGVIGPGDVQWMTAGSGILHQEMPRGDAAGAMHGFQLWANLPAAHKMSAPRYREVRAAEIPVVNDAAGATVRVIAGRVGDVVGPVDGVATRPALLDVTTPAGATFTHDVPPGHTVFAYVTAGRAAFGAGCGDRGNIGAAGDRDLVAFDDGDRIVVAASSEGVRFLLVSGRPIGEPIAWGGPIVMNTRDELREAFADLDRDTFVKPK